MEKEKINYNAFLDSQGDDQLPLKNGLKEGAFKNKGRFSSVETKIPSKSSFDEMVGSIRKNDNSVMADIRELSIRYKEYLVDKTLGSNKSPSLKDSEKETIKKLCEIGLKLNSDENQPEGIGSIGLNSLLLNSVLIQRDKINEMSYEIHTLKNLINTLIKSLEEE
jgi:hypothetical protein